MNLVYLVVSLFVLVTSTWAEDLCTWLRSLDACGHVECVAADNPRCTLIHIRQRHKNTYRPLDLLDDKKQSDLVHVHNDILAIGTNLVARLDLGCYYIEGLTTNRLAQAERRMAIERERYHEYEATWCLCEDLGTHALATPFEEEVRLLRYESEYSHLIGIVTGIKVRPTESRAVMRRIEKRRLAAIELDKRNPTSHFLLDFVTSGELIYDVRENGVLQRVSDDVMKGVNTNRYALVIFGAGHDFADNVSKWNATNSFTFSLITVTPRSLDVTKRQ